MLLKLEGIEAHDLLDSLTDRATNLDDIIQTEMSYQEEKPHDALILNADLASMREDLSRIEALAVRVEQLIVDEYHKERV